MDANTAAGKTSTRTDWILFFVSLVAFIALLMYADEWFWIAMPFMLTYLVKALNAM